MAIFPLPPTVFDWTVYYGGDVVVTVIFLDWSDYSTVVVGFLLIYY